MIIKERLYLTADRKTVVRDGDKRAAFLLAGKGQEVPEVIAKQYGIVDGMLKKKKAPENKMAPLPENKSAGRVELEPEPEPEPEPELEPEPENKTANGGFVIHKKE